MGMSPSVDLKLGSPVPGTPGVNPGEDRSREGELGAGNARTARAAVASRPSGSPGGSSLGVMPGSLERTQTRLGHLQFSGRSELGTA